MADDFRPIFQTELDEIILMPYGGDRREWTFHVEPNPPIRTGYTRVYPTRSTQGPTDPDVDDTLLTVNFMDLSGGMGIFKIKPASDLNKYWWAYASAEGTDGFTAGREAIMRKPAIYTGDHIPIGQVGTQTYGLWGTGVHRWDPDTFTWTDALDDIGSPCVNSEGLATFNNRIFIPLGEAGYAFIEETAPGDPDVTIVAASANLPTWGGDAVTSYAENPRVWMFVTHSDRLFAITPETWRYVTVASITGNSADWSWESWYDTGVSDWYHVNKSFKPRAGQVFPDNQNQRTVFISGVGGMMVWNDDEGWEETNLNGVPPHPNMGRALHIFRPGEALWMAAGGGDVIQYAVGGAVVPASGPGGAGEGLPQGGPGMGLPAAKRGDVISMASDLFRMYTLVAGEPAEGESGTFIEDPDGGDPISIPPKFAVTSVIGWTGKGWHPQWESTKGGYDANDELYIPGVGKEPRKIVVSTSYTALGKPSFRVFWNLGDESWSMQCRLHTHSSRQAIMAGLGERYYRGVSYIDFGEYNAGSMAVPKLWSHGALFLKHATELDFVEVRYGTDSDHDDIPDPGMAPTSQEFPRSLGVVKSDASDGPPRIVLPFGLLDKNGNPTTLQDPNVAFSEGESSYWIRFRLELTTANAYKPPIIEAFSVAFLPVPQNASTKAYTVPLPVDVDRETTDTAEKIVRKLESLASLDPDNIKFLYLKDGQREYRAYISNISYVSSPTSDGHGALNLMVIQVPTGRPGLIGEPVEFPT